MEKEFRSGFISIIGRPNVGKSTLLNRFVGQKISIMSDKPQTTRNRIQGVLTQDDAQFIFIDTPGIHKPKHKLGDFMVKTAENTMNEVDAVMFMVNAEEGYGRGDQFILERLQRVEGPVFLVLNKIDKIHPDKLLELIELYKDKLDFTEIVPISALEGNNTARLLETLKGYLPEGPQYYPEDQVTDHPERFVVSELIREKVLHLTRKKYRIQLQLSSKQSRIATVIRKRYSSRRQSSPNVNRKKESLSANRAVCSNKSGSWRVEI